MAHQARVYDYLLGGKDNDAAVRAAVEEQLKIYPDLIFTARANRAFLDIGTGLPMSLNVHEVAQGIIPEARIVYVDNDPVVLAHARAPLISTEEGATEYIDADLHGAGAILARAVSLLDFSRPVAVTLLAVLRAISHADGPYAIVARLMDAVPPGGYLVISHGAYDLLDQEIWMSIGGSWNGSVQ